MSIRTFTGTTRGKAMIAGAALVCIALVAFVAVQAIAVERAHSTFENYYAFRGCQQLLSRTPATATCRLSSGRDITIIEYQKKWYLKDDPPTCWVGNRLCL